MRRFAPLIALILFACAGSGPLREQRRTGEPIELVDTPFYAQDAKDGAPAALATVLAASGAADIRTSQLGRQIGDPDGAEAMQAAITKVAREHGRVPYPVRDLAGLLRAIDSGQPVLVAQAGGMFSSTPHYAVLFGYDPDHDQMMLRSGKTRRDNAGSGDFMDAWKSAKSWAIVTAVPDTIPVGADMKAWLDAAMPLEKVRPALAAEAYSAATRRWPQSGEPWERLGAARRLQDDVDGAEEAYRSALALTPAASTYNALALVLLEEGCTTAADHAVDLGFRQPDAQQARDDLVKTRAQIAARNGVSAPGCPNS